MQIKELVTFDEMFFQFEIITQLYPDISKEKYQNYLQDMIPHNYKQLAVFEGDKCVALTGFWFGTKLWSGKYIEIDNFIVHKNHRMKGLGKIMTDYINQKAQDLGCTMIVLDAFTGNFKAHRFYYNQGFSPKGFHFVNIINENGLS